ncbi:hypothetical protein HID58_059966 [Brassica napus]|uniref:Uncharacterized protein n=1 Tax=Brassica napus TaxID=3708 RepID=A0ABQ7ZVE8_BRANA|nr:hypothetical protein HID58_059966 [Brassica napus]
MDLCKTFPWEKFRESVPNRFIDCPRMCNIGTRGIGRHDFHWTRFIGRFETRRKFTVF